jgi:hypothetical protein
MNQKSGYGRYPTTCPICHREAVFDLILRNRQGVHFNNAKSADTDQLVDADEVLGYGRYCVYCQKGWTGDELLELAQAENKGTE